MSVNSCLHMLIYLFQFSAFVPEAQNRSFHSRSTPEQGAGRNRASGSGSGFSEHVDLLSSIYKYMEICEIFWNRPGDKGCVLTEYGEGVLWKYGCENKETGTSSL